MIGVLLRLRQQRPVPSRLGAGRVDVGRLLDAAPGGSQQVLPSPRCRTRPLSFSASGSALFSREEVRVCRSNSSARAHAYPSPARVQVDHLAQIRTIHGEESKQEVLMSLVDLVKQPRGR